MLWLVPVSVSVHVGIRWCKCTWCSRVLVLQRRGPNTPENSSSFILHRIEAHHVSSHSPHGLCMPVFAGSSCEWVGASPWKARWLPQGCVFPLPIPSSTCPLPALWPAQEVSLLPRYESSLLRIVFLASKLQRLIFCDRSNLLGKAEVHTESAPLNFPKPLQSIHNVSLYWMQQRKTVSLKRQQRFTAKSKNSDTSNNCIYFNEITSAYAGSEIYPWAVKTNTSNNLIFQNWHMQ